MRTTFILLLAASVTPAADPPKGKLAELAKLYQAYELPLPPKDAKLVQIAVPSRIFINGVEQPPRTTIGFLLTPEGKGTSAKVLTGTTQLVESEPVSVTELKPEPASLNEIHNGHKDLDFAMQCELRGWHELATTVFQNWEADTENPVPTVALAECAWWYWLRAFYDGTADRSKVARRMTAAMNAAPDSFGKGGKTWLRQLNLSLRPSKALPGSVAGYLDEFIELSYWEIFSYCREPEKAPQIATVISKGFDAVPALLEHLNDQRLTRARSPGFNHIRGMDFLVRDFVRDILLDLATGADEELIDSTWKKRTDPKPWQTWLEAAKKQGEEAYLVAHLFTTPKHRPQSTINELMLFVLERKYPHRLPDVFRDALKNRSEVNLEPLASTVARSSLKPAEKKKLLLEAIASEDLMRQAAGLEAIFSVDAEAHRTSLIAGLKRLPTEYHEKYLWSGEWQFAYEVSRTSDETVWAEARKFTERADAAIRVEWLHEIRHRDNDAARFRQRLAFAKGFLNDQTVRDLDSDPKRYDFVHESDFRQLEVRNFAAMFLGQMLELKFKPKPDWTADEWAKFRNEVAKAVKAAK